MSDLMILMLMPIQKSQYRSRQLPLARGKMAHFQGKIVKIFFSGAPPPHPRPLAGAGWGEVGRYGKFRVMLNSRNG